MTVGPGIVRPFGATYAIEGDITYDDAGGVTVTGRIRVENRIGSELIVTYRGEIRRTWPIAKVRIDWAQA